MEKKQFKGVPESNWVVGPCQTKEIDKQVLAVAHAYGWTWLDGTKWINDNLWNIDKEETCYDLLKGVSWSITTYREKKFTFISPETFLANNPMPEEKPEEKTRKPGVKYTLDDWKKEADACRKRAEYWKKNAERRVNENTIMSGKLSNLQSYIVEADKNYTILQNENKALKDSNVELRGANDEMIQNLDHLRERLELQTKGIQALEEDARLNRLEISLLKSDFETKNSELEILEEDYNCLKDVQKYTKVVSWVGWIMFFICLFGFIFLKG